MLWCLSSHVLWLNASCIWGLTYEFDSTRKVMDSYTYELKLKLEDFKPPRDSAEQNEFGDIGGFWLKYDKVAGKFDEDMMVRLNSHLDSPLIFAGLFSAINTSFIILALTGLSAGPSDQTNHLLRLLLTNKTSPTLTSNDLDLPTFAPDRASVRQNCLFFASLGFSLIAAAGAVLARQWLQQYERTGQTGPVRGQAIRRTEKYLGAKRWGLAQVVQALPSLLFLSIALFSIGLVDYLWVIDKTVALVVTVYAVVGFMAYGFTLIAGVIFRSCPFQTVLSLFIRNRFHDALSQSASQRDKYSDIIKDLFTGATERLKLTGHRSLLHYIRVQSSRVWDRILKGPAGGASDFIDKTVFSGFKTSLYSLRKVVTWRKNASTYKYIDKIHAHSVIWMAENAPDQDNMLTIAQNIPFISDFESLQLIASRKAFHHLLLRLSSSLMALRDSQTSENMVNAVTMAKAVAHIALATPVITADWLYGVFQKVDSLHWLDDLCELLDAEELMIQLLSISCVLHWTPSKDPPAHLTTIEEILHEGLHGGTRKGKAASTYLHHCILMAPINAKKWSDTRRQIDNIKTMFTVKEVKADVSYVTYAARALTLIICECPELLGRASSTMQVPLDLARSAWAIRTENSLAQSLLEVLEAFSALYKPEPEPESTYSPLLLCQRQLLIHGRTLIASNDQVLQKSQQVPRPFHALHSRLNPYITELRYVTHPACYPKISPYIFTDCLDQPVNFLNQLLLTPSSQWSDVSTSDLETTARWARNQDSKSRTLSEGILYRYFVHLQQTLPEWRLPNRRAAKLEAGGRIGRVLASALRVYIALCPSITAEERWSVFHMYLHSLATGPVQPVVPVDWMPRKVDKQGIPPSLNTPGYSTLSFDCDNNVSREVERTVVDTGRNWDMDENEAMGSCLIWLAESLRTLAADWAPRVDRKRVVRLFTDIMRKRRNTVGDVQGNAQGDADMWCSVNIEAAGALFLRAWEGYTGDPSGEGSIRLGSDTSGWMDDATIWAFTTWLRTFESHGIISIKEKNNDDIVFAQTQLEFQLVLRYIDQASVQNPNAVKRFKLIEARERLMISAAKKKFQRAV
ncbi:hypothetical protein FRB93_001207 [Tulasnella sp. JGI-2019a]|nr:hypothetical protein FRB93_001207 [Tulasnella sp. JGI-2019a]